MFILKKRYKQLIEKHECAEQIINDQEMDRAVRKRKIKDLKEELKKIKQDGEGL